VKVVVCAYKECYLVKWINSIKFNVEDFKCILVWDHFYTIVLDITHPLLEINNGNWYILVSIDHYSKWVKAKVIALVEISQNVTILFMTTCDL